MSCDVEPFTEPTPDATQRDTPARRGRRSAKTAVHHWVRWLHTYTSMIALVLVLFFGLTGLTLNHPSWTLGSTPSMRSEAGTLPSGWDAQPPDLLGISEYVRTTYGIHQPITDHSTSAGQGQISYRGPGYAADLTFSTTDGSYQLTIEEQGFLAVMNDLHKGRETNGSWSWVIDVAAVFLVVVALTGLGIQLFLRKRRTRALALAAIGGIVAVVLMVRTI